MGTNIACVGDDPYGAIKHGTLTLACMVLPSCSVTTYARVTGMETDLLGTYERKAFSKTYVGKRGFNTDIRWDALEDYPGQIYLAPLFKLSYFTIEDHHHDGIHGLVLKRHDGAQGRQLYSRLGMFNGYLEGKGVDADVEANKTCIEFSSRFDTFNKITWTEEVRNGLPRIDII